MNTGTSAEPAISLPHHGAAMILSWSGYVYALSVHPCFFSYPNLWDLFVSFYRKSFYQQIEKKVREKMQQGAFLDFAFEILRR